MIYIRYVRLRANQRKTVKIAPEVAYIKDWGYSIHLSPPHPTDIRVFITSAAGFIGQATVRDLPQNDQQVLALVRTNAQAETVPKAAAQPHQGDLKDLEMPPTVSFIQHSSTTSATLPQPAQPTEQPLKP